MEHMYLWLVAGVALMALEAIGFPGIGLMFAGLGAITVGILLSIGQMADDAYTMQFIIFFIASAVWAMLLWKPMQRFRLRNQNGYSNMVGETAYVGSGGLGAKGGEVTWSGTIMKAQLAEGAPAMEAGSQVIITGVTGATLIVKPKA